MWKLISIATAVVVPSMRFLTILFVIAPTALSVCVHSVVSTGNELSFTVTGECRLGKKRNGIHVVHCSCEDPLVQQS